MQIEEGRDIDNTIRDNATLTLLGAVTPYFRRLRNLVLTNPVMTWLGLLPTGGVYYRCIKAINERLKDPDARFDLVAHWFRTMKQSPERLNLKVSPSSARDPGGHHAPSGWASSPTHPLVPLLFCPAAA